MGGDRREHSNEKIPEVCVNVLQQFHLTKGQIYSIWNGYVNRREEGINARDCIAMLRKHPEVYPEEILNYFMAMGLELFTKEYLDVVMEESNAKSEC